MAYDTMRCPKCQAEMEQGFIADQTYGGVLASRWVEGAPEKSFWTGVKTKGKEDVEVRTYRCSGCGYLESYAH
jgi:hypothetical protein